MAKHTYSGNAAPLKRIVILEDFVGSGWQANDTTHFIKSFSKSFPVLVVPMIVCPAGAEVWRNEESPPDLTFRPVIDLKPSDMITSATVRDGAFEGRVADLAEATYAAVEGNHAAAPRPYSPFGFPGHMGPGEETGALVSLYSNTPANTLPIVHHNSNTWNAIFPRSARVR
jgi:hypothetical protein